MNSARIRSKKPKLSRSVPGPSRPLIVATQDRFCIEKVPPPCGIVIFGASGDLSHRKLLPALSRLHDEKLLPKNFFVVGFSRKIWNPSVYGKFSDNLFSFQGDYENPKDFLRLSELLEKLGTRYATRENLIFYLATPPSLFGKITFQLSKAGLIASQKKAGPFRRVVIEKPFGEDLESARELDRRLHESLLEDQICRIDHYLGKETVQNILIFRFANAIFEPIWNRRYIDHIQITVGETLGVEHRAGYYERAGALRDIFQNHMFQLLALVAMEPPVRFDANEYRDEKVKVLRSIRPIPAKKIKDYVVRGQYDRGQIENKKVCGYREEKGVDPGSLTETFAAMKIFIDNWRWQGVPFYLRSGKRLARQDTEIAIQFKDVPHSMFASLGVDRFPPNVLVLQIQPEEGISLSFEAKHPGPKLCMTTLNLAFNYKDIFSEKPLGAYERLLLDAMLGDSTLFVRQDMVEESWAFITKILDVWGELPAPNFPNYAAGSWGPDEADGIIENEGRKWRWE